ncbi:MAG TPA: hypothetical protein VFB38_19930 [Chthonomonadaceae bacterium]|nr:hypothetical protein [Chthonomonadaceae bacterium]
MARPKSIEDASKYAGTAEELARYLKQQPPQERFRLTRVSLPKEHRIEEGIEYPALSVEERIRLMDELAEKNRHLPVLPPEAFDREKLYEDAQ